MWFYAKENQQEGPVASEVIKQLHLNGELSNTSLIWKEGMAQWTPLSEVPEFSSVLSGHSLDKSASVAPTVVSPYQAPQSAPGLVSPPQQNGLALASLILGICSFVVCGGALTGIAAIICGHIAKRQIRESRQMQSGDGMATAGLIMGYLATALTIVVIIFYVVAIAAAVSSGATGGSMP